MSEALEAIHNEVFRLLHLQHDLPEEVRKGLERIISWARSRHIVQDYDEEEDDPMD